MEQKPVILPENLCLIAGEVRKAIENGQQFVFTTARQTGRARILALAQAQDIDCEVLTSD